MIGTIEIKVTAARPNMPLSPMFAFKGSPSSLRILEVPKKIGDWNITNINVVAHYPDNTTTETAATRTGNVWVATFEGCNISGKVVNGLEITADGIDEAGQNVQGYVLGAGDIFILERDADIEDAVSKITMRYCETIPEHPTIGDFIVLEGVAKFYDGTKWISIDTDLSEYATKDELAAAVSSKAEISSVEVVADDVEDLSNSLSNYYTKSETSSAVEIQSALNEKQPAGEYALVNQIPLSVSQLDNDAGYLTAHQSLSNYYQKSETSSAVEIQVALDGKQPTGDYALASQIPTNVSQLSNDAGYLTEHQSLSNYYTKSETSSNVELNTKFDTKADLSALNVKRDLTDLNYVRVMDYNHPERIVGFQEGVITYYTMFEKVSDTLYKWHDSTWNGQSSNDYHIELSLENPADPIFSYYRGNGELITSFTIPNGATSFSWEYQDYSTTHVLELLSEDTIALKNDFVSQFRNDCGYLTKTDVIPAAGQYKGYADKARTTAGIGASYPTNDLVVVPALADFSFVDALWDNTTGTILRAYTYARYPWVLSMLNGTTFDPPIPLNWGYWHVQRRIGSRLRTVWRGLGWMSDFVDGVAYLIGNTNSDGSTVDLHLTTLNGTTITSTYSSKAITLNQYETSIETYDGQPNSITCTRSTSNIGQKFVKYVAYTDDLSAKADLSAIPTKTSELSNDSGFITEASYIEDTNENRINADRSVSYIGDGTSYWQMLSKFSTIPQTINLEGTKTNSSYIPTGDLRDGEVKVHLTYDIDKWQIEIEVWDAGLQEWGVSQFFYDTQSSESATELNFDTSNIDSCVWTTPRVVINDNLVTESSLSSIIARLEARIAALENQ